MDIVILGSGNAATVLGRKFRAAGHTIVQVYGRNASAASRLAYEWDTDSTNYLSLVTKAARVYILAVADKAIAEVADELRLPGKVVAHTAASVPMHVLAPVTEHHGVFYPLQTLRSEITEPPEFPLFFDGSDSITRETLRALAATITHEPVARAGDDTRQKMHVAAVVVSNFVNHLYVLAEDYCRKEGLDFRQLLPLIRETAERISQLSPALSQTGPALRHDAETIHKHLELLSTHPQLKNLYILLTESIQQKKQ